MVRRVVVVLALALFGCGEPPPPDTPEAREAVAVCAAEAPPEVLAKRIPDLRFEAAVAAVEAFARARMSAFIDACAPKLAGPVAAEVAAMREQLGL